MEDSFEDIFVIVNPEGEFACRKRGQVFFSKTAVKYLISYRHKKQLENMLDDDQYWKYRGFDPEELAIRKCRLSVEVLEDET